MSELLTLIPAAASVRVHPSTLRRALAAGALQVAATNARGAILIDPVDLARWAESRRAPHRAASVEAVEAAVERLVADAPPLQDSQIEAIVAALGSGLHQVAEVHSA